MEQKSMKIHFLPLFGNLPNRVVVQQIRIIDSFPIWSQIFVEILVHDPESDHGTQLSGFPLFRVDQKYFIENSGIPDSAQTIAIQFPVVPGLRIQVGCQSDDRSGSL
jgi:hypothetical protein